LTTSLTTVCLAESELNNLNENQIEAAATNPPSVANVVVCEGQIIPPLAAAGTNIRWYSSGTSSSLYDSRDGQTYQTVSIGGQVWMAENLNYGSRINSSSSASNNGIIEKYCLSNSESKCSTYGGLYQWEEVMNYSSVPESQGICPSGWHIPSNSEWKQMEISLGMDPTEADNLGARGTTEGTELIVNGGSGFEALMAGKRELDGGTEAEGSYTTFWSSSEDYTRTLSILWDHVYLSYYDEQLKGFSVRCVKDATGVIATGTTFNTGQTLAGTYTYYVSQTINGVESEVVPISLIINPATQVAISGSTEACEGNTITLDAGPGFTSYSWNTLSTQRQEQVAVTGTYEVTVTNSFGCESRDQKYVEFHKAPIVTITGDSDACQGDVAALDAGGAYSSYAWSTGSTSRSINVSTGGNYSVTVKDIYNCSGSDQFQVVYYPLPQVNISGDSEGCEGESIELDAGPGFTLHNWSTNETTRKINVTVAGTYSVSVTDGNGCQNSDDFSVAFNKCTDNYKPVIVDQLFNIDENSIAGTEIGTISASDKDIGQLLSYWIISGNENAILSMDRDRGLISVNNADLLNYEENPQILLKVKVRDNGIGLLSDTADISINVLDLNEPPQIEKQSFVIDENMPENAWVGRILAEDEDQGQSLSFQILFGNENSAFEIDLYTGDITINNVEAIDYEVSPEFQLSIRVSDNAINRLYTNSVVDIKLNDLEETGVQYDALSALNIYPNPTEDKIFLDFGDLPEGKFAIDAYDALGSLIRQYSEKELDTGNANCVSISLEVKGVYFIKVHSGTAMKIEKVICY